MNKFFSACLLGAIAAVSATTTAQDSTYCAQTCRNKGHGCNDYREGANAALSCAQTCMMRMSGTSQVECTTIVNRQTQYRGCEVQNPYVPSQWFRMCGRCADEDYYHPSPEGPQPGYDGCYIQRQNSLVTDGQGQGNYNQGNFVFDSANNTIYKGRGNHLAVDSKGNLHYSGFGKVLACDAAGSCSYMVNGQTMRFADNAVTCDSEGNCKLTNVSSTPIKSPLDLTSRLDYSYSQHGVNFTYNDDYFSYRKDSVQFFGYSNDNLSFSGFGKTLNCSPQGNCFYRDNWYNKTWNWY